MYRTSLRMLIATVAISSLSACSSVQDMQVFQAEFWEFKSMTSGPSANTKAELGLAEFAKGDNVLALAYFEQAIKANPADVHALYGMALVYQNTGQPARAKKLYERILALRPAPNDEILIWADKQTHPIVDIAQVNLQLLGGNGLAPSANLPVQTALQPVAQPSAPTAPLQAQANNMDAALFSEEDLNIVERFKTMRALLDQGLMTREEFLQRRLRNIGALLPITSPPASTGLDRAVPSVSQISGRLRAIGRALEMRALSPAQHTAERTMILDALMPSNPVATVPPASPPRGLMKAADDVRRLEMLKAADLITSDEYARERLKIEQGMQPAGSSSLGTLGNVGNLGNLGNGAVTTAPLDMTKTSQTDLSGFHPGVHLSSYRQQKAATRGWAVINKRFGSVLSGLKMKIERVDLGGSKGVFYRLKAGPLPSNAAAKSICAKLKAKRQYCDPTTINFG